VVRSAVRNSHKTYVRIDRSLIEKGDEFSESLFQGEANTSGFKKS